MIIEFAGMPKSWKTTTLGIVRDYFKRGGHQVQAEVEDAIFPPFPNNLRVEYACWRANRMLNAVLETSLSRPSNILTLFDRGLFDALVFLKLLEIQGYITTTRLEELLRYFADQGWTRHVDLVLLFKVLPKVALERDIAAQLHSGPALITNEQTLVQLLAAYDFVFASIGGRFKRIKIIDTTAADLPLIAKEAIEAVNDLLSESL